MPAEQPKRSFKRVILKLSGEALRAPGKADNISPEIVESMALEIKAGHERGVEIGIVVGGGNFWRGASASYRGMERATADYVGMLATVMNSLALQSMLEAHELDCRVQTAIEMQNIGEPYIRRRAVRHLERGRIVIFAAGTGNPFFSTDTAAALRASEIGADVILKATKVDGVYDRDPKVYPDARRYDVIAFEDALKQNLKVMDSTAFSLCGDNGKPIVVFSMNVPGNITRAILGEPVGTLVTTLEHRDRLLPFYTRGA